MTRQGLLGFIRAAERNRSLGKEINKCIVIPDLIRLASKYDFPISKRDLEEDPINEEIQKWFLNTKINPINRNKL